MPLFKHAQVVAHVQILAPLLPLRPCSHGTQLAFESGFCRHLAQIVQQHADRIVSNVPLATAAFPPILATILR